MKIVFFGTPEFAVESLEALLNAGPDIEVAAVVTVPDKVGGRGHRVIHSPVKLCALEHGLPLLQPEKLRDPEFLDSLRGFGADLFVVIAFRMLPREVWQMPPMGTFNLHASLLPRYRGAAPINHAIINGETRTGVSTFLLKHEIDTGDILMQEAIEIGPDDNIGQVYDRLMHLGARLTVETVRALEAGTVTPVPQEQVSANGPACPAPKIFKETCEIDWTRSAAQVHNLVRGLSPYPCAWAVIDGVEHKFQATRPTAEPVGDATPGTLRAARGRLLVATGDCWIEVLTLQPAGKRPMDARAWLNGHSL